MKTLYFVLRITAQQIPVCDLPVPYISSFLYLHYAVITYRCSQSVIVYLLVAINYRSTSSKTSAFGAGGMRFKFRVKNSSTHCQWLATTTSLKCDPGIRQKDGHCSLIVTFESVVSENNKNLTFLISYITEKSSDLNFYSALQMLRYRKK